MSGIAHFTDAEIAQWREDLPGHWFVEIVKGTQAALVAIPITEENTGREIKSLPGMTPELLDGKSMRINSTGGHA